MLSEDVKKLFKNEIESEKEELAKSEINLTKLKKIRNEKFELKKQLTSQLDTIIKTLDHLDQQIDQRYITNCILSNKIKFKNNITSIYTLQ
jgi:hypothetical protein